MHHQKIREIIAKNLKNKNYEFYNWVCIGVAY